jgi:predicted metal-dependent phosphoesterase TrpH
MDTKRYKIDLHTHSIISYDGGITPKEYERLLQTKVLDVIAITDHNEISLAQQLHKKVGEQIIVGEEISTKDGEIIGLFLQEKVGPGESVGETISEIVQQGGIVYVPHPFEVFRKGLKQEQLEKVAEKLDVIEVFNGRGRWRNKNKLASAFAQKYTLATAASSDSHGHTGIGWTYSIVDQFPTKKNICALLHKGMLKQHYAPLISYLDPMINKIKNKVILTGRV